jgi:chromosome segregation ATPase
MLLFEKRASKKRSDTAKVKSVEKKSGVVEVKQGKPEGRQVEAEKKEVVDPTEAVTIEKMEQLRRELKEFKEIRGGIRTTLSSIEKLVPKLKENKERLVKDLDEKRKEVEQLTQQIPKLKEHKAELLQSIEQKKEQKTLLEKEMEDRRKEVEQLTQEIPQREEEEKKLGQQITHNQMDLARINDQIKEVMRIQEYGIDFLSGMLVYATQKSKQ